MLRIINKNNQIILSSQEEVVKYFKKDIFKDLLNNPDDYEDSECDSACELIYEMDKKCFSFNDFRKILKREFNNLTYFFFDTKSILLNNKEYLKIEK